LASRAPTVASCASCARGDCLRTVIHLRTISTLIVSDGYPSRLAG
jgi:hypothetical protein